MLLEQLREALHETQLELREANAELAVIPWLIAALQEISLAPCAYEGLSADFAKMQDCTCDPCTARGALKRFQERRPIPGG
jgi:hypothetical protein